MLKQKLIEQLHQNGELTLSQDLPMQLVLHYLIRRFTNGDYADRMMHSNLQSIDYDTYRLYHIFDFIQQCDTTPQGNPPLSAQENYLILTLSHIQQCSSGQTEGIEAMYAIIDKQDLASTAELRAETFIHTFVQNTLKGVVDAVVEELCPNNPQKVHQVQYVKNMISQWIGLQHTVSFDEHTQVLDIRLLQLSKQDLLRRFYSYFPNPSVLSSHLQAHINATGAKAYPTFAPLLEDMPDSFEEDGTITLKGCDHLLEDLGYISLKKRKRTET